MEVQAGNEQQNMLIPEQQRNKQPKSESRKQPKGPAELKAANIIATNRGDPDVAIQKVALATAGEQIVQPDKVLEQSETQSPPRFEKRGNAVFIRPVEGLTHKFTSQGKVDLSGYQSDGSHFVDSVGLDDLSQFAIAAQEGLTPERITQNLQYVANPEIRSDLEKVKLTGKIEPIKEGEIKQEFVYHAGCSIFVDNNGNVIDKVQSAEESGKYGGENRVSYFGVNQYDALIHGLGNYNNVTGRGSEHPEARVLLMTINVKKLQEDRNIFTDPEALLPGFEDEYKNNFVVHNGIPISAIEELEILKYEGYEDIKK